MKFIGGPMHGKDVPDELPRFTWERPDGSTMVVVRVWTLDENCVLDIKPAIYMRQDWFVGVGKPLLPFFGLVGAQIDDLIEQGRRVMVPLC